MSPAIFSERGAQAFLRVITGHRRADQLLDHLFDAVLFDRLCVSGDPIQRLEFLTSSIWNIGNQYGSGVTTRNGFSGPPGASFGALVFIYGSTVTALLTMVVAVPLSMMVALSLVYRVPRQLRPLANALVELMAGVPSVVYGLWGLVVLVPWIGERWRRG